MGTKKHKGVATYMMLKAYMFNKALTPAEKLLVGSVLAYWSPSSMPFVSNKTLEENTGYTERYIRELKKSLKDRGICEIAHNKDGISVYIFDEDKAEKIYQEQIRTNSKGGNPKFPRGTPVPEGGNPSSARGGTGVPTKNTTKTSEEVSEKNSYIDFKPLLLPSKTSDKKNNLCYGISVSEIPDNITASGYYITVNNLLFSKWNDDSYPVCKQVLYALEHLVAYSIYRNSEHRQRYLEYWNTYSRAYKQREQSNSLDDLVQYIKSNEGDK